MASKRPGCAGIGAIVPLKPRNHGVKGSGGSWRMMLRIAAMTSRGLYMGTDVLQPVPMPSAPLIKTSGTTGQYQRGSMLKFSSLRYSSTGSSSSEKIARSALEGLVYMYLAAAWSLPPCSLVPNCPDGTSRLMLFEPTKFWAKLTMVFSSDISPWWYAACSEIYPTNCATLRSDFNFFLKALKRTLRCDGLKPSTTQGMDLMTSYLANCTSSLCTKSLYVKVGWE
mmetsp:Transcript_20133/g.60268  ORF Transcript_20133/g.60268 Transcript_20133/m.60268 type:complete len:225 (-) Transcript_20133:159-833(-)